MIMQKNDQSGTSAANFLVPTPPRHVNGGLSEACVSITIHSISVVQNLYPACHEKITRYALSGRPRRLVRGSHSLAQIVERMRLPTTDFFLKIQEVRVLEKSPYSVVVAKSTSISAFKRRFITKSSLEIVVERGPNILPRCIDTVRQFCNSLRKCELWLELQLKKLVMMARRVLYLSETQSQCWGRYKRSGECSQSCEPLPPAVLVRCTAAHHIMDADTPIKAGEKNNNKHHCSQKWKCGTKSLIFFYFQLLHPLISMRTASIGKQLTSSLRRQLTAGILPRATMEGAL